MNQYDSLPRRLEKNYRAIRGTSTVVTKRLEVSDIEEIQKLLNDSQPKTPDEKAMQVLIQYLYKNNKWRTHHFLVGSLMQHLLLWVEAIHIFRYFDIDRLISVHWNGSTYECSAYSKHVAAPLVVQQEASPKDN